MLCGRIEMLTKPPWACLRIRWSMARPLELEHKDFWAVRELNADPKLVGEKRLMNLTSLDEWRSEAYESTKMFKQKVKKWHDRRILKREFNVGDKVLLFRSRFRFSLGKLLYRWEG